jgi:hypothetical protein
MTVDIYGIEDVQVIRQGVSSGGNGPIVGDKNGVIEITKSALPPTSGMLMGFEVRLLLQMARAFGKEKENILRTPLSSSSED